MKPGCSEPNMNGLVIFRWFSSADGQCLTDIDPDLVCVSALTCLLG